MLSSDSDRRILCRAAPRLSQSPFSTPKHIAVLRVLRKILREGLLARRCVVEDQAIEDVVQAGGRGLGHGPALRKGISCASAFANHLPTERADTLKCDAMLGSEGSSSARFSLPTAMPNA
jgi:hypothetical protein